ncbi:DUF4911 domain-containing protein [Thermanaerosceptrum fracticalcis]|uniref:DUF4911 domain-containing protein n=1 Tax=Thermanaerosceptrum fracticalcis TaxID=1712410 RepID=UPI0005527419|nr:DUF4911 domain-containing protein [Thermanaerosceptrum fracticalcis]
MSAYHGKNTLSTIRPENREEALVKIKTKPEHINFIIKILETHSHLTIPVQLDPQEGYVGLHTPKDRLQELLIILENIPRPLEIINKINK